MTPPIPTTRMVPRGWSAHHAPVAAGGMNGRCDLYGPAPTGRVFDEATGTYEDAPHAPVAAGVPCRVQDQAGRTVAVTGDEEVQTSEHLVQLPVGTATAGVVRVVVTDGHAGVAGAYTVDHVNTSTEAFTVDLWCTRAAS